MGGRPNIPQPIPPPPPPDYADQAVRAASLAERQKQIAAGSRRKSFITPVNGSLGGGAPIPVGTPTLTGTSKL
jgi:hypothetical protein